MARNNYLIANTMPAAAIGQLRDWSSTYRWIPIVGGFFTFALAFMAGANDVPVFHDPSSALKVGGVLSLVLSWIVAPLIAAVAAFILFSFTRLVLLRSEEAVRRVSHALAFYYGLTVMVLVLFIIYRASPRANIHDMGFGKASLIAGVSAIVAAAIAFVWFIAVLLARRQLGWLGSGAGKNPQKEHPPLPPASEAQPENTGTDSTQQEPSAEEILKQFQDLRVLETVYEVDEEEEVDSTEKYEERDQHHVAHK